MMDDPDDVVSTPDRRGRRTRIALPARRHVDDPDDVIRHAYDKSGVPVQRNTRARRHDRQPSRGVMMGIVETMHDDTPPPVFGAYPKPFLPWALRMLGCSPREVLHVCSGSLSREDVGGGVHVDIRPEARPDVVADGRALPFADASFRAVLIDPPYTEEYARDLYGTEYPRPSHLLREASRVVKPCGRIGLLHFTVSSPPPGCSIVAVRGVTQGCGYRIRALTIYERAQDGLFDAIRAEVGDQVGDSAPPATLRDSRTARTARDQEPFRERVTGVEPATFSLGSKLSRAEGPEMPGFQGDSASSDAGRGDGR